MHVPIPHTRYLKPFVAAGILLLLVGFGIASLGFAFALEVHDCSDNPNIWRLFRPQVACTPFSYGAGPDLSDLPAFLGEHNLLQMPAYPGSSTIGFRNESRRSLAGKRDTFIAELSFSSAESFSNVKDWYVKQLAADFVRGADLSSEDQPIRSEIAGAAQVETFGSRDGPDRGVIVWTVKGVNSTRISMFQSWQGGN